ncbi:hypothetical protein JG687_00014766 [Phytophthora cactorum]|uniref:Uncharacterized protein n=1 Tax=Phytophthora cactorum TaxID=29920 RepID=A0A8T1TZV0_9STRA|nr:hypothetical protein JG687_00014766 [Phytophthora cactorum]
MPRNLKPFQPGHDVLYGLEVAKRNSETFRVGSVACRFWIKYSRQNNTNSNKREQRAHTISTSLPYTSLRDTTDG